MTPNDPDRDRWESVGRKLLAEDLEVMGRETLQHAFVDAMRRIQAGEELRREDIDKMRRALQEASQLVEVCAEVSPEDTPVPGLDEFLDKDGKRRYAEEVERRRSEVEEHR
ncbi:hypothetical protein C475_18646 [Halosimplex carlsbadense 2-9-1]|uniref:Uncharacterized protein n=1 Tax=Halosimplex carlsbadense 2-9-1 TaxID=797114 RepID=M0CGU9_9EURY|nr:hypothetical protein [Halosimplex carlsbadense]ELZ21572.1 hypothetical protein C475_18646 [Halosimplex carlsbadense 2-9-1]